MIPSAKVGIYKPHGDGRDSYIMTNNGGFCTTHPHNYNPNYTKNNGLFQHRLGNKANVAIYQRDGGGRDSYIFDTNGGFTNQTFTNTTFWDTLRDGNYNSIKHKYSSSSRGRNSNSSSREDHLLSMNWYNAKEVCRLIEAKKYQIKQSKRLSQPKKYFTIEAKSCGNYAKSVSQFIRNVEGRKTQSPKSKIRKDSKRGVFNHCSLDGGRENKTLLLKALVDTTEDDTNRENVKEAYLPCTKSKKHANVGQLIKHNYQSLEKFDLARINNLSSDQACGSGNRYAVRKLLTSSKKRIAREHLDMYSSYGQKREEASCTKGSRKTDKLMPTMKLKDSSKLPKKSYSIKSINRKRRNSKRRGSKLLMDKSLSKLQLHKWKRFLKEKKDKKNFS
ncbi:unnamed protein product [Moneuplotes crassus]|uniref:Uncharacterized protein n=1 Tax=Euplotes crassus TaxID=5936 RepID=A0AAD1UCJ1_EUPCR|nr:unnamed protein product [Moneuplotes crassus]